MKVQPLFSQLKQDRQDIIMLEEGILDAISSRINDTKNYFVNVNKGVQAKQHLKQLDGVKNQENDNIQKAAINMRTRIQHLYQQANPQIQQLVLLTIKKTNASPITGQYLTRNYYSDYLKYSTILPLFDINKAQIKDTVKNMVADKFVGLAITTLTGIPNIDDIKTVAELSAKAVKTATVMSNNWQQLRVA